MYIIKTITYTLLFLSCFASCKTKQEELPLVIPEPGTLEKIEQRGVLNVCSYYNTTDYYVYKGIPKGFHYELVKDFADYLGVKLNIEINTNIDESIQKLNEGQYDLIAMSLSVTDSRKEDVQFSLPLFTTSQVLVQHTSDTLLQSVDDLKGRNIFTGRHLFHPIPATFKRFLTIKSENHRTGRCHVRRHSTKNRKRGNSLHGHR